MWGNSNNDIIKNINMRETNLVIIAERRFHLLNIVSAFLCLLCYDLHDVRDSIFNYQTLHEGYRETGGYIGFNSSVFPSARAGLMKTGEKKHLTSAGDGRLL